MCPSTPLVPHRLPADRTSSRVRAIRHWGHVHAGQHIMHELSLTHVHPVHHRLPSTRKPAHSRAQQRPMTIQPLAPDWARTRATRLTTTMTTQRRDLAISAAGPVVTQDPGWPPVESERTPDARGSRRPVGHQHHPSRDELHHVR
jgi:hypothetical protein